jgi:hypothetical protein
MKKTLDVLRATLMLALLTFASVGLTATTSEAQTEIEEGGVICYDDGHACHLVQNGQIAHHGKFQEIE